TQVGIDEKTEKDICILAAGLNPDESKYGDTPPKNPTGAQNFIDDYDKLLVKLWKEKNNGQTPPQPAEEEFKNKMKASYICGTGTTQNNTVFKLKDPNL